MAELREELISVVSTLNHIIDTQLDSKPKPVGREVYIICCGYDKMCVYDNKEDVIQLMIDEGHINDYDCWFDDLDRDSIAEICEDNYNLPFRQAMDKAYDEYCHEALEEYITDLYGTDASIRNADESQIFRVHLA
jgi:hypothetical protein